ncbi:hypothetical protein PALU110988_02990 [Paenibacillus lupini]|uniref:hypothetical protein n=1 Tax=Paenibacillus lupini TaxID=1450204 RepID=UPI001423A83B|nr:hypothetical protein [Paenibacillus lupini]NIK21071.1 hypothetical protein [Paenibacillus lupini]
MRGFNLVVRETMLFADGVGLWGLEVGSPGSWHARGTLVGRGNVLSAAVVCPLPRIGIGLG